MFACFAVFVLVPVAHAAFFDTAGKSARAMGMGEVFLASSTDATSYWYNPASLAMFTSRQVGIGYGKPSAFISELMASQLNVVLPVGEGRGLGLGFSYGGIDVASDMVVSGAYGMAIGDNLSVGGNVKVLYWAVEGQENVYGAGMDEDLSKVSFSLDLSAIYSLGAMLGVDNLTTGLYVKDAIMPNISESGDDGGALPIEMGFGLMAEQNDIVVGADVGYIDGNTIMRIGAESPITGSALTVRGGFIYESDFADELEKADVNLGIGYSFRALLFDYAYNVPFAMKETGGKHYVSFGFSF
ncbi:hypothetical protein ACFL5H_02385 [Candidatus Latescibacterota bacterium]